MTQYRQILRLHSQGISQRSIAQSCQCSRNTVAAVLQRASAANLTWPLDVETDTDLERLLFPEKQEHVSLRRIPDFEKVSKELARSGVTLKLLWMEYCEECRQLGEQPFMYSQFCYHFQKFAEKERATMHIPRKPGDRIEVDWAGDKLYIVDRNTGAAIPVYLFVGVLPFSMYAYAEGCLRMDMENWIHVHVNMFQYFGGSAVMLVPDNLKTGVDHAGDWYTPQINRTYRELAEHYNTAVVPARVRKPKDKSGAEGTVGVVSTRIIAALRNRKFFSLEELNRAVRQKLDEHNKAPFTKREGSRYSVFQSQEKAFLHKLPTAQFELAQWKVATVQYNYHISVEKMQYSVPYEYIKQKVDVRLTKNMVEVFYNQNRIASHRRLYSHPGQYSTVEAHMPEDHQKYLQWDGDRFIRWAESIGPATAITVKGILTSHKIQQQGYKSCMGLLKLADKYSVVRLENACIRALQFTPQPSYKSIKNILVTGQDKLEIAPVEKKPANNEYGFTRGAEYYGRKYNMLNQPTYDKLVKMRMSAMADAYRQQTEDPTVANLSFDERFAMVVDVEYWSRHNNRLKRNIHQAAFDQPHAALTDINYTAGRLLDRSLIDALGTCEYIRERHNVIIMGATGSGKTYIGCALGMEACKQGFTVRYVRLPELLEELAIARGQGNFKKVLAQWKKTDLLILDEWMLISLTETEARDLLEIIHARHKRASTIFCSQFAPAGWYSKFPEATIADAILDRIVHDSYTIEIRGADEHSQKSMREVYGVGSK